MRKIKIINSEYYPAINAEIKLWKAIDTTGIIERHYISITIGGRIKTRFIENKVKALSQYNVEKIKLERFEIIERNREQ